ncbi:MAG: hypothetical protein JWM93_266 [Frankiales bacterium]|nr:hypothetical protein [Frankiales bacterium]
MLCDKAVSSQVLDADVLSRDRPTPAAYDADVEREYLEHREAVFAMLHCEFPRFREHEELYQEAWTELLELRAKGQRVDHPRALLKQIAWRRAADAARRRRPEVLDPASLVFTNARDESTPIDEDIELRLDADVLRMVIDTLEPRQAASLKLRFDLHLTGPEIQERLGLSPKRLEKVVTEAYRAVLEQVQPGSSGGTRWQRRQRSLLLACEMGIASPRQRARAQEMVDRDPKCRAMLRAMRSTLNDVAVVLPMPPAAIELGHRRGPVGAVFDWVDQAVAAARQAAPSLTTTRTTSGALVEQASGGLAGGLGVGGAAKIVAACLALGGTAAICVHTASDPKRVGPPADRRAAKPAGAKPAAIAVAPVVAQSSAQPTTGRRVRPTSAQLAAQETPVSSSVATPPPSPAPAGATEFGPGSSGSAPVSMTPAAAPANGGGEFGP